jgi:hypothetical protein
MDQNVAQEIALFQGGAGVGGGAGVARIVMRRKK